VIQQISALSRRRPEIISWEAVAIAEITSKARQRTRANTGARNITVPFLKTLRYSLRRALSLDSVDGGTHNPKVDGSTPPPATNAITKLRAAQVSGPLDLSAFRPLL
jgi:hypothetical protein